MCPWSAVPPGLDHVEPVEPVKVVQGSLVTLTCEARGFPLPTLTWMKDGQQLSLHRNLLLDGQETQLQLPDVTRSDEGLYRQPQPTVTWTKGGAMLGTRGGSYRVLPTGKKTGLSNSSAGKGQHEISALGDAGIFTCVATNPAGSVRRDIRLSINSRPVFKELPAGRNGVHAAVHVAKVFKNESDCVTIQHQQMEAAPAAVQAPTQGNVRLVCVQVALTDRIIFHLVFTFHSKDFDESYVQTGQGQLYSWSSQTHQRGGSPMGLRCNHTIIYEGQEERQGPVLQLLKVSGINSVYNIFTLSLDFQITTSLLVPDIDECSQGSHMCHYNQQCVNTVGTYRCQARCGPGYKPSITGTSCEGFITVNL
ncbi:hypothetical protein XENOCAPTIV_013854, partial [Xenoophorus captivus]